MLSGTIGCLLIGSYAIIADCVRNGFGAGSRGSPKRATPMTPRCPRRSVHATSTSDTRKLPFASTTSPDESIQKPTRPTTYRRLRFFSQGNYLQLGHRTTSSIELPAPSTCPSATRQRLVPEHRIVDVWNQYVREIGAPDEAIVTAAEIHNMRDGSFTGAQLMWARGNQTI